MYIDTVEETLGEVRHRLLRALRPEWSRLSPVRRRERQIMMRHRERALRRVAVASQLACEDWAAGLDVDEAMLRLRAELHMAAEFEQ